MPALVFIYYGYVFDLCTNLYVLLAFSGGLASMPYLNECVSSFVPFSPTETCRIYLKNNINRPFDVDFDFGVIYSMSFPLLLNVRSMWGASRCTAITPEIFK